MSIDLTAFTDTELDALGARLALERTRRAILAAAPARAEQLAADVYAARGGDGHPWRQPLGAHDAYPLGAVVTHRGQTWRSILPANVWAPVIVPDAWGLITEPTPSPEPEPAVEPWAPGQAVKAGTLRSWQSATYRAVQAHTTQTGWEPPAVPALWVRL